MGKSNISDTCPIVYTAYLLNSFFKYIDLKLGLGPIVSISYVALSYKTRKREENFDEETLYYFSHDDVTGRQN